MSNTYGHLVTRVRAELVEGYGGQLVRDWDNAERLEDVPASVQSLREREDDVSRQVVSTDKLMNTAGEFEETDRVEWDGDTYDVGFVEEAYQQGRLDHLEVLLHLTTEAAT